MNIMRLNAGLNSRLNWLMSSLNCDLRWGTCLGVCFNWGFSKVQQKCMPPSPNQRCQPGNMYAHKRRHCYWSILSWSARNEKDISIQLTSQQSAVRRLMQPLQGEIRPPLSSRHCRVSYLSVLFRPSGRDQWVLFFVFFTVVVCVQTNA